MASEPFDSIADALKAKDYARYRELVRPLVKANSADPLWPRIAALHDTAINVIATLSDWPANETRQSVSLLLPAVGHLPRLTVADAADLLALSQRLGPTHAHRLVESIRPHVARTPGLGRDLGAHILAQATPDEQLAVWATSFCFGAPAEALDYVLSMPKGHVFAERMLAAVVQRLPASDATVDARLREDGIALVDRLLDAASRNGRDAWFAIAALSLKVDKARDALMAAVPRGEPEAVFAACALLHRADSPRVGSTGLEVGRLVDALLSVAMGTSSDREPVDQAVASLMYTPTLHPVVVPRLMLLGAVPGVDCVAHFEKVFDALCDDPPAFGAVLTAWLLQPGVNFDSLRSLLSKCSSQPVLVTLDTSAYAAAQRETKVKAGIRLLALCFNGPVLCAFIGILAENPTLQPEGLEQAEALLDLVFREYPNTTVGFLKPRTRANAKALPHAALYRRVLANALRWKRVLARLPRLAELRPTETDGLAFRAMLARRSRAISRMAKERSVFAALVTQVHIAQGHRFATHTSFGPPQVASMSHMSHAIELPSSERSDPVGGAIRRMRWLGDAR